MSYTVTIAHPDIKCVEDVEEISGGLRSYYCGCRERREAYPRFLDGECKGAYCDACWTKIIDEWLDFRFPS